MNAEELKNIIEDFIKFNNKGKAILIDGPWGCGKTYSILKAIEDLKTNSKELTTIDDDGPKTISLDHVIYVSLFGFESIDEIHTDIYQKYYKKAIKFKKAIRGAFGLISKAASIVPISGIDETLKAVTTGIDYYTHNDKTELENGPFIVFFDDLERLSKKISYTDLLGYFNNRIFESKGRIICLCNQETIKDSREKEFKEFKEKVFDREYCFTGSVKKVLDSMFDDLKIDNIQSCYLHFHLNLRFAYKTKIFYLELINHINGKFEGYEDTFSQLTIFRTCILVVENSFIHGKSTINVTSKLKREKPSKVLEFGIHKAFLDSDYTYLDSLFSTYGFEKGKTRDSIFKQNYLLLSDEDKRLYEDRLSDLIYKKDFTWSWGFQIQLGSVLSYNKDYCLTENQLDNIVEKIKEWSLTHDEDLFANFQLWNANRIDVINQLKTKFRTIITKKTKQEMLDAFKNDNYVFLNNKISSLNFPEDGEDSDLDLIFDNGFFLPDLARTISSFENTYCEQLVELLSNHGSSKIKKFFLKNLNDMVEKNPNSNTLKFRIKNMTNQLNDN